MRWFRLTALTGLLALFAVQTALAFEQPSFAKNYSVSERDGLTILHVKTPYRDATSGFSFVLVPRGSKAAKVEPGEQVVEVPLRRVCVAHLPSLPSFATLGLLDKIVGISAIFRVSTPEIIEYVKAQSIPEIGVGAAGMARQLNIERLHELSPDAVFVSSSGIPEFDKHPKLIEAGFTAIVDASYMEPTPLGRLEWIKFLAEFFGPEVKLKAGQAFERVVEDYERLAKETRCLAKRPSVISGSIYRGYFYAPGGDSYMARFIADAGADYVFKEDKTQGSIPLSQETLLMAAREADFWLQPGLYRSLEELEGSDDRLSNLRPVQGQNVINNDAQLKPSGANDYWETGYARPDLVLADLVSFLHPEVLPDHSPRWYRRLPQKEGGLK